MNITCRIFFYLYIVIASVPLRAAPATLQTTDAGNTYASGAEVFITQPVKSDLLGAGGRISIEDEVGADAAIAGGTVDVRAPVGQDLRVAGGTLTIAAPIGGELVATGGTIRITNTSTIAGSAWIAGGNVVLEGKVGKGVRIYANTVSLAGQIDGDAHINAQNIAFEPGARINGNLYYASATPLGKDATTYVNGTITREQARSGGTGEINENDRHGAGKIWFQLVFLLGLLVAGMVICLLFPNALDSAQRTLHQNPWSSLGIGLVLLIMIPFGAILVMITVIGIPIGLALLALYPVVLLIGFLASAFFIGRQVANAMKQPAPLQGAKQIMFLALALLILAALAWIPLLGDFLMIVALVTGLGAWAISLYRKYRTSSSNPEFS